MKLADLKPGMFVAIGGMRGKYSTGTKAEVVEVGVTSIGGKSPKGKHVTVKRKALFGGGFITEQVLPNNLVTWETYQKHVEEKDAHEREVRLARMKEQEERRTRAAGILARAKEHGYEEHLSIDHDGRLRCKDIEALLEHILTNVEHIKGMIPDPEGRC